MRRKAEATRARISQLGHATLRNAARRTGDDLGHLSGTVDGARAWLTERFAFHGEAAPGA